MSATYTAWNGQPYPWPPPDGWYEASDGRWWAPGYGPDDTGDQETVMNRSRVLAAAPGAGATTAPDKAATSAVVRPAQAAKVAVAETERTDSAKRSLVPLVAAGAVVAFLLAAGLGFLAVRDDSTSAAQGTTTTAAEQQTAISPTTAPPPAPTTLAEPAAPTTSGESTTTTTAPAQTETTTVSTTAPPTTLPATSAATVAPIVVPAGPFATDGERAAAWRGVLDQGGIDSGALTDADVIGFGNEFCLFVKVSEDLDEFDEFRKRALSAISGELTESELSFAISAGVLVFCPEDAKRIGISL